MIKLIKNANVYAPNPIGMQDILIIGEKIVKIAPKIEGYEGLEETEVFDLKGKIVAPGYIDLHVHITGGGGEQGPASRVPESQLSLLTRHGLTTVVGLLGTDSVTRSLENLVAKARALTEEGITAYCLTGAYSYPSNTITGNVEHDIVLIPPFIGCKIAVSDHRSSNPDGDALIAVGSATRRAGMLSNTPGIVVMHMGEGNGKLDPLFYALEHSDVPAKHFLPTHMLRTNELMEEGVKLVRMGGFMDCTAGFNEEQKEEFCDKLYDIMNREGVDVSHISLSSDAFGSQPRFNDKGECIGLTYASPEFLHKTVQGLVKRGMALEKALGLLTTTPATILGKTGIKGCVAVGADADLLVLDNDLQINGLFARGQVAIQEGEIVLKGRFE